MKRKYEVEVDTNTPDQDVRCADTAKDDPDEFRYTPFKTAASIRLLYICRTKEGFLSGRLEAFSLDSPYCPRFTALSYVWGPKIRDKTIMLNGRKFKVLQNVYPMLEFICDNDEFRYDPWVWIDSVCIDQENLEERGSQVQLMSRIYKGSRGTAVWLGPATKETDEAIDFFCELGESRSKLRDIFKNSKVNPFGEIPLECQDSRKWRLLEVLLMKPWWRRVWTLQEFVVPEEVTFYCGNKSMDRLRFQDNVSAVCYCHPPLALINDQATYTAWNRRWLRQWHESRPEKASLLALMNCTAESEATDPRDKIYSVLVLANDVDRNMVGRPAYHLPVGDVFLNFVRSFIETHKSLDVICFAQVYRQLDSSNLGTESELPSWVPDWQRPIKSCVVPLMVSQNSRRHIGNLRPTRLDEIDQSRAVCYAAAGASLPQIRFSPDLKKLTCRGLLVDHIDGLGGLHMLPYISGAPLQNQGGLPFVQSTSSANIRKPPHNSDNSNDGSSSGYIKSPCSVDNIIRCLVLDREDTYLTYPAKLKDFRPQFKQLLASALGPSSGVCDPGFYHQYQQFKDLLIGGSTLDDICRAAKPATTESSPPTPSQGNFAFRFLDTTAPDTMACRPMTTEKGYLGMVSKGAQKGDLVCVLFGCNVPVVLRKQDERDRAYAFVGECYLHGFMNGEIMNQGVTPTEEFVLI